MYMNDFSTAYRSTKIMSQINTELQKNLVCRTLRRWNVFEITWKLRWSFMQYSCLMNQLATILQTHKNKRPALEQRCNVCKYCHYGECGNCRQRDAIWNVYGVPCNNAATWTLNRTLTLTQWRIHQFLKGAGNGRQSISPTVIYRKFI